MSERTTVLDKLRALSGFKDSQRAAIGFAAAEGIVDEAEKLESQIKASTVDETAKLQLLVDLQNGTANAVANIAANHILSLGHDPIRLDGGVKGAS